MKKFKKVIKLLEDNNLNYNVLKIDGEYKLQFTLDTKGAVGGFSLSDTPGFGIDPEIAVNYAVKSIKLFLKTREEIKNNIKPGKNDDN